MTERVQKLVDWFKKNQDYVPCCGIFSTRNFAGDPMKTVYSEGDVIVDYCGSYDYIEIFGLTDDEFVEAANAIEGLLHCWEESDDED